MNVMPFQEIYNTISPTLPEKWKKIVILFSYLGESYIFKYYIQKINGEYIDCYQIPGVSEDDILSILSDLDDIVYPVRKKLRDKWKTATMIIKSDGSFNCEFDYDTQSDDMIKYIEDWKKKYLSE